MAEGDVVLELLEAADDLCQALADGLEGLDLIRREAQRRHRAVALARA